MTLYLTMIKKTSSSAQRIRKLSFSLKATKLSVKIYLLFD